MTVKTMKEKRNSVLCQGLIFITILLICNTHLLGSGLPSNLIFKQDLASAGEWWRFFSHPFVHVSWYHLLLDGLAVSLLWRETPYNSVWEKLFVATGCGLMSLIAVILFSQEATLVGYCGLSGVAHGLMTVVSLGLVVDGGVFTKDGQGMIPVIVGWVLLLFVGVKSIIEVVSGAVIFSQFHGGELGVPIVHAHLGGVIGGLVMYSLRNLGKPGINQALRYVS